MTAIPSVETKHKLPATVIKLDWRAYYLAFSEAHGGDPVQYRGRLLFKDGWMHSATDYAGPEWSPPKDERRLRKLQRAYWDTRLRIVVAERNDLRIRVRNLEEAQTLRSCPLQQVVSYTNEGGKRVTQSGPLDLSGLRGRLGWLEQDVTDCLAMIKQVDPKNEYQERKVI